MNENLFEARYDVTKKTKLKKFYETNKILIFSTILILIIAIVSVIFYSETKEKKKILLSDKYLSAKIYLENGDKNKVKNILKTIIFANDSTYSTLSLFLILNENLIVDQALFQSNFVSELELLEAVKQLVNTETIWKPHALLLLGDYFASKKEYLKAKEFYMQILFLKNLHKELYNHARSQLIFITND